MPLFHVFKLLKIFTVILTFNSAALRKAEIVYRFKHEINSQSTKVDEIANSTDPDESAHNELLQPDLHHSPATHRILCIIKLEQMFFFLLYHVIDINIVACNLGAERKT